LLFGWRAELGLGKPDAARFARVRLAEGPGRRSDDAPALQSLLPMPAGAIAVDLSGERRVFATPGSDRDAVRRFMAEREAGRR
jgi:hypothetical protein